MENIDPTSIVEPGAEIESGVRIGPFCHIGPRVKIGKNCVLKSHVAIRGATHMGPNCQVHPFAVIGDSPQDRSYQPGIQSFCEIGEGTVIREGANIHRGSLEGSSTRIGKNCLIMSNAHIAHDVQVSDHVNITSGVLVGGHAIIGEGVFLAGNAAIHQFVKVGRLSIIAGNAGITKDFPPFCIARAASLNDLAGINTLALERAGLAAEDRAALSKAYKSIFRSSLNISQALELLGENNDNPYVNELLLFIKESKRGVCIEKKSRYNPSLDLA